MKQLTNEVYRTKKKLELLESEGIGQLLVDVLAKFNENPVELDSIEKVTNHLATLIKQDYLGIIQRYKPNSKQSKLEFNG